MTSHAYDLHLSTPEWQVTRARVILRAGGICESCKARTAASVHHLSYHRFGHEPDDDLIALCRACHGQRHRASAGQQELPLAA